MIPEAELASIAARVASWHRIDRELGQGTGRAARVAENDALAGHLRAVCAALDARRLDVEHAEAWPAADYDADREAVRRLAQTVAIEHAVALEMPAKGRKRALPMAAMLLAQACERQGTRPTLKMLREVTQRAGIVLSDDALTKALAAVKGKKSPEKRGT